MSAIIEKIKDVLHKDTKDVGSHNTDSVSSTHHAHGGPHHSSAANALDPRVDSYAQGSTNTTAVGQGSYNQPAYASHDLNKIDSHAATGTTGLGHTSHAHHHHGQPVHNSEMLNKLDPRVDNDSYNSHGLTSGPIGVGQTAHHRHGQPLHDSKMLNKLDPRVDNDSYNSHTSASGPIGVGQTARTNHGQPLHNSEMLNKLDPRVETDYRSGNTGIGHSSHSQNLYGQPVHNSEFANKMDPRVNNDSYGANTLDKMDSHVGPQYSSGPVGLGNNSHDHHTHHARHDEPVVHKSAILNKLDPRVDSDVSKSSNVGTGHHAHGYDSRPAY